MAQSESELDLDRFRLRRFLETLAQEGELETHPEPVRLCDVARLLEGNPKAVLLEEAGPSRLPLAGNVMGTRQRMARAFGVAPRDLLHEVVRRQRNKPVIVEVPRAAAPVQEVVLTGDDIDLTRLPINLQHGRDGGPYVSAAMDFAIDPATGWTNVGVRRLMIRGRRETGIDLTAPGDLRAIFQASVARGERLAVSMVIGGHPIDYLAATMRVPVDELGLMATLRGAPMAVVKGVTNDIRVPADAEWVIEGFLDAKGYVEAEGPYGEFLGYYGGVKTNPVFRVTAITHRSDAIFETISISGRTMEYTDSAQLCALRTEVQVWRALETAVREPLAVYVPAATGGVYNARVAIRQRVPGEARNAIAATLGSQANVKNVFIVDPDIDIFSDAQMEWALGTRFQPQRDLVVSGGYRTLPLDPSLRGATTGSKAGYDLTLPFGTSSLEMAVPEPPSFGGARFASVRAALEHGPKYFEELMAAIACDDGRDVILALEELRETGELDRLREDGRYLLAR